MKKNCKKQKCDNCSCHGEFPQKVELGTVGKVELVNIIVNADGSSTGVIECDKKFEEFYKSETKVKKVTKAGIAKFIISLLIDEDDKNKKK